MGVFATGTNFIMGVFAKQAYVYFLNMNHAKHGCLCTGGFSW